MIEYLELAGSFQSQADYQRNVPIADVVAEVIVQWEDWVHGDPRLLDWQPGAYSAEEIRAVGRFHAVWDAVGTCMRKCDPMTIEQAQTQPAWDDLRRAAASALRVFKSKGVMPEDIEVGPP